MKTRGIQNAINRLAGARKMGSAYLINQAEDEARHTILKAKEWMTRTPAPAAGETDDRYTPVALAGGELERALNG
jgi:hypothetical protein